MGKIIRFDPDRRRKQGRRSWTRPEDYVPPAAPAPQRDRPRTHAPHAKAQWPARLTVAGIIAAGVAVSLLGLQ
ncbi:hypothetical protein [Porphyrobacter sp. GA68]|uniref:hypothetical protein n=1 Tax=Porphyrobacter sp. GA68 TaxID=2883480 RepID=UPI001D186D24|nr:hypothetical protein [Porphyrobacter sp. GA68]